MDSVAQDFFQRMVETISDYGIFALDLDGRILNWNRGAERLKGYSRGEIVGKSFEVFYPQEAVDRQFPKYELEVAARDGRFEDEGWRIRKDGSKFWARVVITALRDDAGHPIGFAKVTADLTQKKEAEESLRRSEERFRLMVENVQDYAILSLDPEGRVVSWNEGAQRLKGYSADEIIGRSFQVFYPPDAVESGFPGHELEVALRGGRFEDEGWRVRKDGSRFWANVVITALRDSDKRLVGYGKVTRDLTARREAERQARELAAEQAAHAAAAQRSEELRQLNLRLERAVADAEIARDQARRALASAQEANAELDQFAYVASHDLKAPLRGISSLAQWIEEDVGAALGEQSVEYMRMLQLRVHRLQALIDGILAYSRAGRVLAKPEVINTGKLLREVIDLQARPDVTIDVSPQMPTLVAERIPLQQVFLNLVGNAVKFSGAVRPDVTVTVTWRDTPEAFEFAVTDNGPGIPAEYQERVWGAFQTLETRDKVEGTGIGLAIVKKIVEKRGGQVSLESTPGQGATFRFTWSKAQSAAEAS
jgi:PAS domain S-box-containing protein